MLVMRIGNSTCQFPVHETFPALRHDQANDVTNNQHCHLEIPLEINTDTNT